MRTIETILLLPILSLILSCSYNDKQVDLAITKAEELLDVSPDSSLAILDKVDSLKTKWRTSQLMRYELVRAQAQNKAYINFSTDSILKEVVDYYDTHGTANERMTARYMLGCAYRDMEDAPRALECFIDATEQADTTSADCDYNTLFRIYAQIGDLYQHQDMPDMAQEAHRRFSEYALKAGDIYHYIRGKEFLGTAYFSLGDTVEALRIFRDCIRLYTKHGFPEAAASAYPIIIKTHIARAQYDSARICMDIFEKQSGLFVNGKIAPERLHYYYTKGLYYLGIGEIDSAEHCFRQLPEGGFEYAAYKGLLNVYRRKHDVDSVCKYAQLSDKAMDDILAKSEIDAVIRTSALYDYNRMQRIANASKLREQKTYYTFLLVTIAICILATCAAWYARNIHKRNIAEKEGLNHRYVLLHNEFSKSRIELENLIKGKDDIIKRKEQELARLKQDIEDLDKQFSQQEGSTSDFVQEYEEIVANFRHYATPSATPSVPTETDWIDLRKMIKNRFPKLYSLLSQSPLIADMEFKVCVLTYLGFKTGEIAVILNSSMPSVSNTKASACKKLFNKGTAASLYCELSRLQR